jgi:hypothetical protein
VFGFAGDKLTCHQCIGFYIFVLEIMVELHETCILPIGPWYLVLEVTRSLATNA